MPCLPQVYHGVPVIAMPIYLDQYDFATKLVHRAGMGVKVDFHAFTEDSLLSAISEVLSNSTYRENAARASKLLRDRPLSAKEEFLYHVEYVIRHKGIGRMAPEALQHYSTLQLYGLDIWASLLGLAFGLLAIAGCGCMKCLRCCCRTRKVKTS